MALKRTVSALTGGVTAKHEEQAINELKRRAVYLGGWEQVSAGMGWKFTRAYLWQIAQGKRPPSRRLLLALGIVKPDKRSGIRVRMSAEEAREIVDYGTMPVNVKNRIRYQMGVK